MARTEAPTTHGWFLDPKQPEQLRFWSGTAWTSLTKFPTADELAQARLAGDPSSGAPLPAPRPQPEQQPSATDEAKPRPRPTPAGRSSTSPGAHREPGPALKLFAENVYSDVTILLTFVYIGITIALGWAILAAAPVVTSVIAFQRREKAAFLSALAAAMAIVVGIGTRR